MYAIPRKDVSPLAGELLNHFSTIDGVLSASTTDLSSVSGMGEGTIIFIKVINAVILKKMPDMLYQPTLFSASKKTTSKVREMRVFANDEIANALIHVPKAPEFENIVLFKKYLEDNLPYNSVETRQRRANYILDRFFPDGDLNTPLLYFVSRTTSSDSLKQVFFYQLTTVEPILKKVVEDRVYPSLPIGKVTRDQLREFMLMYLPDIETSSQSKVLRSLLNSYNLLGIGREEDNILKFQLKPGTLDAFTYVLSAEFPESGIYSFDTIFEGPSHRWLLWDKEWIRKQLYVLRDIGVVSKVSEIDTVRQFSLEFGQREFLKQYFDAVVKSNKPNEKAGNKNHET
jgi:DNA repair protein RadC